MHLVYQSREKKPLPSTLPADLIPPSHRSSKANAPAGGVLVMPQAVPALNTGSSITNDTAPINAWGSPPAQTSLPLVGTQAIDLCYRS